LGSELERTNFLLTSVVVASSESIWSMFDGIALKQAFLQTSSTLGSFGHMVCFTDAWNCAADKFSLTRASNHKHVLFD